MAKTSSLDRKKDTSEKTVHFWVDESEMNGKILIAVVSIDSDWYAQFLSEKILHRKGSTPYRVRGSKIHYAEDDLSTRSDFISWVLRTASVSAYILIKETPPSLDGMEAKKWVYHNAFPKLLLERLLIKYQKLYGNKFKADIAIENLTNKPSSDLRFYKECVKLLDHSALNIRVIGKNDPMGSLPDYFAGSMHTFLTTPHNKASGKEARTNIQFIQKNIGLIVESKSDNKTRYYSRGREIGKFIAKHIN